MKNSTLYLVMMAMVGLASCTSAPDDLSYDQMNDAQLLDMRNHSLPDNYSMLELGWAMSAKAVDVFDPWLPTLTIPSSEFDLSLVSVFPPNTSLLIRDEDVHVYSLSSLGDPDKSTLLNLRDDQVTEINVSELPTSVPLVEEEILEP